MSSGALKPAGGKQDNGMKIRAKLSTYILAGVFFVVCGCAPQKVVVKPLSLERLPERVALGRAETSTAEKGGATAGYESLQTPVFAKAPPEEKLLPREPIDARLFASGDGPVMINVEKMPLADFIIHALGETLKIAFVMDEATMNNKSPVTMRMPRAESPDRALAMVLGMLEQKGLTIEARVGALYITQKPPEPKGPLAIRTGRTFEDSPADILQVVPLRHLRTSEIDGLIREIVKSGVQIKPYPRENVLLLFGRAAQMKQIIGLVEAFDVPTLQNKQLFLLKLNYWQIDDFVKEISKILKGVGFNVALAHNDPGPLFMPIRTLNSILVASPDENTTRYILDWRDRLDTPEAAGSEERSYTFLPQYTKASDLVASIQKLYGVITPGAKAPTAAPGTAAAKPAPGAATVNLPDLKIAADDNRNIVVIMALPERYRNILSLLKELDRPVKQVLIEATIVELTLTDELKYGVEWYLKNTLQGGPYVLGTLGALGATASGLSFQFLSQTGGLQAMVTALATMNKANILSTPRLTVLDNQEATIQVGQDVPTVTSEIASATATTTAASNVVRSIQYRSTGVMLRVKPTINTEGLLTLTISQEVSETGAAGVSDSPIILTRKIDTTVVVGHGQTVALGGLMKDVEGLVENKVPLLGDIPFIGNLFKYTSNKKEKTELLVLVTPLILTSTDDAVRITNEMKKELKWLK